MSTQTESSIVKDYVDAGGLRTYYEVQGSGPRSSCCTVVSHR
jgi:hypothetical protein